MLHITNFHTAYGNRTSPSLPNGATRSRPSLPPTRQQTTDHTNPSATNPRARHHSSTLLLFARGRQEVRRAHVQLTVCRRRAHALPSEKKKKKKRVVTLIVFARARERGCETESERGVCGVGRGLHPRGELHDEEAMAYAAGEQSILAKARRAVLVPLAAARPSLLPPTAVTLKAAEWAWGIVRSRCVRPEVALPPFEDPVVGARPDCVVVLAAAGEVSVDGVATLRMSPPSAAADDAGGPSPAAAAAAIVVGPSSLAAFLARRKADAEKAPRGLPAESLTFDGAGGGGDRVSIQLASHSARTTVETLFELGVSAPVVGGLFFAYYAPTTVRVNFGVFAFFLLVLFI